MAIMDNEGLWCDSPCARISTCSRYDIKLNEYQTQCTQLYGDLYRPLIGYI